MLEPIAEHAALTAMIAPALLLTSSGSLIISTNNRLSRIVDRARALNDLMDEAGRGETGLDYLPERTAHWGDQLDRTVHRGTAVRHALLMLYAAFAAFVGTSLALALDTALGHRLGPFPTLLAVAGVALMLVACVFMVREALQALESSRYEVRFFRALKARRQSESALVAAWGR